MSFRSTFLVNFIIFISLSVLCNTSMSQPSVDEQPTAHNLFGTDDILVQGNPYRPVFRRAKGHRYFVDESHVPTTVWIKGVKFEKVLVRYDLEIDQVVGKFTLKDSSQVSMVFETQLLDSFNLHNEVFHNANIYALKEPSRDFLVHVHSGNDTVLIEYKKAFIDSYNKTTPYGRYSEMSRKYLLVTGGKLENISTKRKLIQIYPSFKDQIKSYLKTNKLRYRQLSLEELKKIAMLCEKA